jgi:parvulin-like peptidyl-prolyl isomerase
MGFVRELDLVAPVAKALFSMEMEGELSPVIESSYGFHILRLDEIKEKVEESKLDVFHYVSRQDKGKKYLEYMSRLKSGATIEVDYEFLKNIIVD